MATPHVSVPLPQRDSGKLRIVYPRLNDPVTFISRSSKVCGTHMHWGERNSFPCVRHLAPCPCNGRKIKTLWYGWLLGVEPNKRGRVLLQLTESAVWSSEILKDERVDLRGAKINLQRVAMKQGTIVKSTTTLEDWKDHSKEPDPDVFAALLEFYKIEIRHWADDDQADKGEQ